MVEYDIESIQIQSLQNVIRLQDGVLQGSMKDSTNVAAVWRNECYRMSVQKRILEDECVRLGKLSNSQFNEMKSSSQSPKHLSSIPDNLKN